MQLLRHFSRSCCRSLGYNTFFSINSSKKQGLRVSRLCSFSGDIRNESSSMGPHFVVQAAKKAWVTDPVMWPVLIPEECPSEETNLRSLMQRCIPQSSMCQQFSWRFGACLLKKLERTASRIRHPHMSWKKKTVGNCCSQMAPHRTQQSYKGPRWSTKGTDELQLNHVDTITRDSSNSLSLIMEFRCVGSGTWHFFSIFDSRYPQALFWVLFHMVLVTFINSMRVLHTAAGVPDMAMTFLRCHMAMFHTQM